MVNSEKSPMPAMPVNNAARECFTLRYNKQTVQTVTFFADSLDDAIRLGREYCEVFRLRFIRVDPIAVDLEEIIRNKERTR